MKEIIDGLKSNMAIYDMVRFRSIPKLIPIRTEDFSIPTVKEHGFRTMFNRLYGANKLKVRKYE